MIASEVLVTVSGATRALCSICIIDIGHFRPVIIAWDCIMQLALARIFGYWRVLKEMQDMSAQR